MGIFRRQAKGNQFNHFMKNLSLMGAVVFILANGAGAWTNADASQSRKHLPMKQSETP